MYNEYDDHDPEQGYWDEEDELDCWDEDAYIFEQHRYQQEKEAQAHFFTEYLSKSESFHSLMTTLINHYEGRTEEVISTLVDVSENYLEGKSRQAFLGILFSYSIPVFLPGKLEKLDSSFIKELASKLKELKAYRYVLLEINEVIDTQKNLYPN
ncbi:TPA: hypothetical protein QCY44_005842, partial [Bacillus cereus]|nr:hypothetical protein [Bacillus cereus]HDR8220726.1 hypothetical protein [Bacillus cereus]HDR8231594.1 hypothetical protein [Bacillus cereus]